MKRSRWMTCGVFFLTFAITHPSLAAGAPLSPPLVCELLVRSGIQVFSSRDDILPKIRQIKERLAFQFPSVTTNRTDFRAYHTQGLVDQLRSDQVATAIARLNGIEQTLAHPSDDNAVIAMSFTGSDIENALQLLEANKPALEQIYNRDIAELLTRKERRRSFAVLLVPPIAAISIMLFADPTDPVAIYTRRVLEFGTAIYGTAFAAYRWLIPDQRFPRSIDFLKEMRNPSNAERVLLSGSNLPMRESFHRMMMSPEGTNNEMNVARLEAVRRFGLPYLTTDAIRAIGEDLLRERLGQDVRRHIYLDHIVFDDEATREPTWLFFYRAYLQQPKPGILELPE